jgi:large subunit ribosomal protein L18
MSLTKRERRIRIRHRIRKNLFGTAEQPRMSVFRSNKQIYVQFINAGQKVKNKSEQAKLVGKLAADKSKEAGITTVIFDRGGYLYHGRVKSLADAAREGGLKF